MPRAHAPSSDTGPAAESPSEVRLDVWLDIACLFKTRSAAQQACRNGKVTVNGQDATANRHLKVGDALHISRPFGRTQELVVRGLAARHVAKADARALYEDRTPQPTPEEIERRRIDRMYRAAMTPAKAPGKRARRALRALKERQG
jgi:ribosome-associated heat shock protein Hsp15